MIWFLLVLMQLKHFIADYPLQGKYMLGKFKDKGWVLPLAAHCAVHFLFTAAIAGLVTRSLSVALGLGLLDFTIHFIMDRIKASPKMLGKYVALSKYEMQDILQQAKELDLSEETFKATYGPELRSNVLFWWSLGLDQMVHHLTDILVIALIMAAL